jgi:hypothetical protein
MKKKYQLDEKLSSEPIFENLDDLDTPRNDQDKTTPVK